jgi:hypothetical protein
MIIVVALVAALVVTFVLVFRDNATIRAILPFGTEIHLEGKTEPPQKPGQIRGEDLQAGQDLTADNQMGGDVEIKRATAGEDIRLSTQAPASDNDPKD